MNTPFVKPADAPVNKFAPSRCQHVWRLPGERREVQCGLPHDHGGMFHQRGAFITPAGGAS